jgi:hypothetical protein
VDEVLAKALTRQPVAIEWTEPTPVAVAVDGDDASDAVGLH